MLVSTFYAALRKLLRRSEKTRSPRYTRLSLERLEARLAPAVVNDFWTGTNSNNWEDTGNWTNGVPGANSAV